MKMSVLPLALEFFDDHQKLFFLKLELAVVVDVGAHFVKATYNLEDDGLLALICYDQIRASTQLSHYPNLQAIVHEAFPSNLPSQNQWIMYAVARVLGLMQTYEMMVLLKLLKQLCYFHRTELLKLILQQGILTFFGLSHFLTLILLCLFKQNTYLLFIVSRCEC